MRYLLRISLVLLLVLPLAAAKNVTEGDEMYAKIREVGEKLKCQCESNCSYTISGCNMLGCSFRTKMTQEIRTRLESGASTDEVFEQLVAEYGSALRTAPRAEGFGLFGWAMPFAALGIGLVIAPFIVRRWKARRAEEPSPEQVDEKTLSQYEQAIEKELDELD